MWGETRGRVGRCFLGGDLKAAARSEGVLECGGLTPLLVGGRISKDSVRSWPRRELAFWGWLVCVEGKRWLGHRTPKRKRRSDSLTAATRLGFNYGVSCI